MYLDAVAEFEDPDGDIVVLGGRQEFYTERVVLHCVTILLRPIQRTALYINKDIGVSKIIALYSNKFILL